MPLLLLVGFVAGLVAGISPCILPVLPVVLAAGATTPVADDGDAVGRVRSRRPLAVVAGLVVSFSLATLFGSLVLRALHLPQDLLRDLGLAALGAVGLGLVVPAVGDALERPFARLGRRQPTGTGSGSGFVLGLALGALYVPCAGPVLAAVTTVAATHRFGAGALALTACFALGTAVPLLVVATAGRRLTARSRALRRRAGATRRIAGAVLLASALVLALNLTDGLQRAVPGYTSALQRTVEGSASARHQLAALTGAAPSSLADCPEAAPTLEQCGAAPAFTKVTAWLNTPGDRPLTLAGLRGQVVLVDFWTYSCINCQRSLPHVEAWYARYHRDGLEVVGVHTPEFAFEHVVSNVRAAAAQLGVDYPVAVDDDYGTWNAYGNEYWPAEYLVDASGRIRHVTFGEGDYGTTERQIRALLTAARPGLRLPPPTDVPDRTPTSAITPESYLGYDRLQNDGGDPPVPDRATAYALPADLPANTLAFGGTWTVGAEAATAGAGARLELAFDASDVYLVLGGHGTVGVSVDGGPARTVVVSGIPRLYTLVASARQESATVLLTVSPGVEAYDFTFG